MALRSFLRYSMSKKYGDLEIVVRGHSRSSKMIPFNPAPMTSFLSTFHSNHRPILHRFRDKRRFPSKVANFSHPRVFNAPAEGAWNWVSPQGSQETRMMGLPERRKSFKIGLVTFRMTSDPVFKVTAFLKSNISNIVRFTDKVSIEH